MLYIIDWKTRSRSRTRCLTVDCGLERLGYARNVSESGINKVAHQGNDVFGASDSFVASSYRSSTVISPCLA